MAVRHKAYPHIQGVQFHPGEGGGAGRGVSKQNSVEVRPETCSK